MLSAGVFGAPLQGGLPLFPASALGCGCPMPWGGSRPQLPFSFAAGGGFPPWLEAAGRGQLSELHKSCFPVMGCTPGAMTNYPAALAPSLPLPFSFIPLLPPCFSCSLILFHSFLSLSPFCLPLPLLHTGEESRETARAEACLLQQKL